MQYHKANVCFCIFVGCKCSLYMRTLYIKACDIAILPVCALMYG